MRIIALPSYTRTLYLMSEYIFDFFVRLAETYFVFVALPTCVVVYLLITNHF